MEPVSRRDHNITYVGPTSDIGDLTARQENGEVLSHWLPSEEELELLNNGGHVELGLVQVPIPPVSLGVVAAEAPEEKSNVVELEPRRR